MARTAHAIAHYEAELKAKDAQIAAKDNVIAQQQAALNQQTPDVLDAEDKAALAQAEARYPDIAEIAAEAPAQ